MIENICVVYIMYEKKKNVYYRLIDILHFSFNTTQCVSTLSITSLRLILFNDSFTTLFNVLVIILNF